MTPQASTLEPSPAQETHRLDLRACVRHLFDRGASAPLGEGVKLEALSTVAATVRDISATGVGLLLENELPPDSMLLVEPWERESRKLTLLARVLRPVHQGEQWYHGCELGHHLTADELQDWLD